MSEFWIFLTIAGLIITFAKKEDTARKKRGIDNHKPQDSQQADLDRQLKELFGESYSPKPTVNATRPIAQNIYATNHTKGKTAKTATPNHKPNTAESNAITKEESNKNPFYMLISAGLGGDDRFIRFNNFPEVTTITISKKS